MPSLLDFKAYTPEFIGRPVNRIAETMKNVATENQKIVDTTNAVDIALSNSEVLDADMGIVNDSKARFREGINDIATSKDHYLAKAKLSKLTKDVYLTNNELKRAGEEYVKQKQYETAIDSKIGKDGFTSDNAAAAKAISMAGYEGGIRAGKSFVPFVPAEYIDVNKLVDEYGKGFMPEIIANSGWERGTGVNEGYIVKSGNKTVRVTPEEIRSALHNVIANQPGLTQYYKDKFTLDTYGTEDQGNPEYEQNYVNNQIEQAIDYAANKYSRNEEYTTNDLTNDAPYWAKARLRQDKAIANNMLGFSGSTEVGEIDNNSMIDLANSLNTNKEAAIPSTYTAINSVTARAAAIAQARGGKEITTTDMIKAGYESMSDYVSDLYDGIFGSSDEDEIVDVNKVNTEIKKGKADRKWDRLDDNQKKISNDVFNNLFNVDGKLPTDMSDMSNEDKAKYMNKVSEFISTEYKNALVSADINIPSNETYGGTHVKDTPIENLTEIYFRGDTMPKDGQLTGLFSDTYFHDPTTGETFTGNSEEFKDMISDMKKGTPVTIVGRYSPKNPFATITDNLNFYHSYKVQIGDKQLIMAGMENEYVSYDEGVTQVNLSAYNKEIGMIFGSSYSAGQTYEIPLNIGTLGYKKVKIKYNKSDGIYTGIFNDGNGETTIKVSSPEALRYKLSNYGKQEVIDNTSVDNN